LRNATENATKKSRNHDFRKKIVDKQNYINIIKIVKRENTTQKRENGKEVKQ